MKRRIPGLYDDSSNGEITDGIFLVRVERTSYQYHLHRPYFALRFSVLQPQTWAQKTISGRISCSPKTLWKLSWFLRDFGYDQELLGREEIDEKALVGLKGILKVARRTMNGRPLLDLDGFAPAGEWESFAPASVGRPAGEGAA
jgi:hypothetical protein